MESNEVLVERVETVMGWPLLVVQGEAEPLIEDEELGRRLGYEEPRMRAIARDFALPSDGVGAGFVGRVARALGIYDDPEAVSHQDVVIGGRARRAHVTYGPAAIARLTPALRHAHARMAAHGYHVVHGVMQPRGGGVVRAKTFVLGEMLAAAVSGADGMRAAQTSIPGVDDRKAG